ncbi:MAG TPA: AbrB/MazE/SpoVT family DNA-binding domain-containing protein [Deltaproteobacteria bacterium]|nr:AbrB/MazE/SpoVT family DNA-binding domain-containing protein [Deltaproteobacteria bacterium]
MITQLRRRSQVTLPSDVVKKMDLREGDNLEIAVENDTIIIKPVVVIDRAQAWFWSAKWQDLEKEADRDIRKGKTQKAKSVQELLQKLDR